VKGPAHRCANCPQPRAYAATLPCPFTCRAGLRRPTVALLALACLLVWCVAGVALVVAL
jgi:hypothetical protein